MADDVDALLAEQVDYYQARAGEYDEAYAGADSPLQHLDSVLALLPVGGRVLEIACGTGQWTRHLAGRFARFWLSHVPWSEWPRFWSRLAALLAPGGVVVCVDETAHGLAGKETWSAQAEDVVTRSVADGRTFQVAKLRLDPVTVVARLAELGWVVEPLTLSADLFALRAHSEN